MHVIVKTLLKELVITLRKFDPISEELSVTIFHTIPFLPASGIDPLVITKWNSLMLIVICKVQ